jgi:flagellar biosynthesis/type III secretory pathway M-ring protein FliF/YscJ
MVFGLGIGLIGIVLIAIVIYSLTNSKKKKSNLREIEPKSFFRKLSKKEKWISVGIILLCVLFILFVIFFL